MTYKLRITDLSPETLSMGRLGEYIKIVSDLIGKDLASSLHFIKVAKGSACPTWSVDEDAREQHDKQLASLNIASEISKENNKRLEKFNDMLREDNSEGEIYSGEARILYFPGVKKEKPKRKKLSMAPVSIKGELIKIGGVDNSIPFTMQHGKDKITGNISGRDLAQEIAQHLFSNIQFNGEGQWEVDADLSNPKLVSFTVNSFKILNDNGTLEDAFDRMMNSPKNEWATLDKPVKESLRMRNS